MPQFTEKFVEIKPYINWMKLQFIPRHVISYLEFNNNNKQTVICAHGLTRNAHDFDKIATHLSTDYKVISISYPGRGNSDYFKNKNHYNYHVYAIDTFKLLKQLKIENPFWLGTSMGGIIGMIIASKVKIKGLILNDIGPAMPIAVVKKIKQYASKKVNFTNLEAAKKYVKLIYSDFGINAEEDWDHLTKYSFNINDKQQYVMNYDQALVKEISTAAPKNKKNIEAWWLWKRIKCKLLVIRGDKSNILVKDILQKMQDTKKFDLYTVEGVGHAPALVEEKQIKAVKDWLDNIK